MVRDMVPLMPELAAAAGVATIVVGVLHIVFFVLETFMWRSSIGRGIFATSKDMADLTAGLAANQGIYNFFLGLSILAAANTGVLEFKACMLMFVAGVGLFGALTVGAGIIVIQALPAMIAFALTILSECDAEGVKNDAMMMCGALALSGVFGYIVGGRERAARRARRKAEGKRQA